MTAVWQERIAPDEEARFEAIGRELAAMEAQRAGGTPDRVLHKKANAGALAFLEVGDDVPAALRVSLFGSPGRYPAFVRFSNGAFHRQSDKAPDIRGIALKVMGVPGRKLIPGLEDAQTQDFSLIQSPSVPFASPEEFVTVVRAMRGSKAMALPRLIGGLGFGRTFGLLAKLAKLPQPKSLPRARFFSAAAYKLGAQAVRFGLEPLDPPADATAGTPDGHGDLVTRILRERPLRWRLSAQLYVDESVTPIEDSTVGWPEDKAPFVPLATLVLPRQDLTGARGQALRARIEQLSFDPWHATEDLRPLGGVNRARKHAYKYSSIQRAAAAEPVDHEGLDDVLMAGAGG